MERLFYRAVGRSRAALPAGCCRAAPVTTRKIAGKMPPKLIWI